MRRVFRKLIVSVLTWEARGVLRKYKPKVVAITGSVGKTSAKDAIFAVLAHKFHTRASEKSFNSEIGVPLTILGVPNGWTNPFKWFQNIFDGLVLLVMRAPYPEWLVLEVGADRPGDIRSLAEWLPVDVAVITRLPEVPVHVEYFDSVEQLVEEKASLLDAVRAGGAVVLYADDERTKNLQNRMPAPDAKVFTFGFKEGADIRGMDIVVEREQGSEVWPVGVQAKIAVEGCSAPVSVAGTVGAHALLPVLAGAAVGHALGLDMAEILAGLEDYDPPQGRMLLLRGLKGSLIIDDTYNSSPAAVMAALDTLVQVKPTGRRIAVLGDMLELGRFSVDEHKKAGAHAAKCCDLLLTVGFRARATAEAALDNGMEDSKVLQYESSHKAGAELQNLISEGDCVLVKGSQGMRMERVVEEIMLEPARAADLLVRQDREWKKR